MALSLVPLALYAWGIKSGVSGSAVYDTTKVIFLPFEIFKNFFSTGWPFYALILLIGGYFLWKGTFEQKVVLGLAPLVLIIFVYNPLLSPFIARYITSYSTYWRMLWLLPAGIGIGMYLAELYQRQPVTIWGVLIPLVVFGFAIQGNIFGSLVPPENVEKTAGGGAAGSRGLSTGRTGKKPWCTRRRDIAITTRQVESAPRFFWSRQDYINEFTADGLKNKEYKRRMDLERQFYDKDDYSAEQLLAEMIDYDINVVVAPRSKPELVGKLAGMEKVLETENYIVFHIPGR